MDNAWDAYRARAYTYPAEVVPSQASLAMGESEHWRYDPYHSNNIVPDQGSTEGKHKRSCEIALPVELSLPRTRVVASVGGREERGVVIVVVWRGAEQADYENSVFRCMATSSLVTG